MQLRWFNTIILNIYNILTFFVTAQRMENTKKVMLIPKTLKSIKRYRQLCIKMPFSCLGFFINAGACIGT